MIFFEVFRQLDIRLYRTVREIDSSLNPSGRYIIDGDNLIILGTNISCKWDLRNKVITSDNPYKHFDFDDETLYWFSQESAEGAVVRMISNAFRQWYNIDPFSSFIEFEQSEADINHKLADYGLRILWDMDRMAVLRNDDIISFETAVMQIMEDDALKATG